MRASHLLWTALFVSSPLALAGVACGDSAPNDAPSSPDAQADATQSDAGKDAGEADANTTDAQDAGPDGATDAGVDAAPTVALVMAFSDGTYGSAYKAGAWESPAKFSPTSYPQGGGITASAAGKGYVTLTTPGANPAFTTWSGTTWPAATAVGATASYYVGSPVATPTKLFMPFAPTSAGKILLDTFDLGTSSWTLNEDTGVGDLNSQPAVAALASGEPLVVTPPLAGGAYVWTKRTGSTWSAPAAIPGVSYAASSGASHAPVALLAKRVGADQIVGLFVTRSGGLSAATFSAGAWSAPTEGAADVQADDVAGSYISAAALPDGRVAVAYVTSGSLAVKVGYHDGTTWSAFAAVPGAVANAASHPAMAAGVAGATLELVLVDASGGLRHARLTGSTWSPLALIDNARVYTQVRMTSL